jgi:hypothetical protein
MGFNFASTKEDCTLEVDDEQSLFNEDDLPDDLLDDIVLDSTPPEDPDHSSIANDEGLEASSVGTLSDEPPSTENRDLADAPRSRAPRRPPGHTAVAHPARIGQKDQPEAPIDMNEMTLGTSTGEEPLIVPGRRNARNALVPPTSEGPHASGPSPDFDDAWRPTKRRRRGRPSIFRSALVDVHARGGASGEGEGSDSGETSLDGFIVDEEEDAGDGGDPGGTQDASDASSHPDMMSIYRRTAHQTQPDPAYFETAPRRFKVRPNYHEIPATLSPDAGGDRRSGGHQGRAEAQQAGTLELNRQHVTDTEFSCNTDDFSDADLHP